MNSVQDSEFVWVKVSFDEVIVFFFSPKHLVFRELAQTHALEDRLTSGFLRLTREGAMLGVSNLVHFIRALISPRSALPPNSLSDVAWLLDRRVRCSPSSHPFTKPQNCCDYNALVVVLNQSNHQPRRQIKKKFLLPP